jgi:metallo-beta-lactamase family protein
VAWGDRAILFSGDLGVAGAPLLRDPNRAWDATRDWIDFVVTESTYGDRTHPPRAEARAELRRVIRRALADGGKVLVPAFSIGRTQELIYELNGMIAAGELREIPIIVDGPLGLSVTRIYREHPDCYDAEALALIERGDPPLEIDALVGARDGEASRRAVAMDGPAIVIAGSGMCEGGRIRHHLTRHLPDARTDVLLVGYQAAGTLGRALQSGRDRVFIGREEVPVRARITTLSGLSAHADRDGLAAWFSRLPRRAGTRVFVTHGEPEQSEAYARLITERHGARADVPDLHERVTLD